MEKRILKVGWETTSYGSNPALRSEISPNVLLQEKNKQWRAMYHGPRLQYRTVFFDTPADAIDSLYEAMTTAASDLICITGRFP